MHKCIFRHLFFEEPALIAGVETSFLPIEEVGVLRFTDMSLGCQLTKPTLFIFVQPLFPDSFIFPFSIRGLDVSFLFMLQYDCVLSKSKWHSF